MNGLNGAIDFINRKEMLEVISDMNAEADENAEAELDAIAEMNVPKEWNWLEKSRLILILKSQLF